MEAKDLRIGNLIKDLNHFGRECKVIRLNTDIDNNITYVYNEVIEIDYSKEKSVCLKPILLTKEWIEKFDWFSVDEDRYTFRDIEYYSISEEGSLYFNGHYTCTEIKYVHQLQNLYFALTGYELNLK